MMLYVAFMMGLAGSLHCLGMCGPIAFALPVRTTVFHIKLFKYSIYNIGRVSTYVLLGLIIGIAGKGFVMLGLQQILSISTGIIIILSVLAIQISIRNNWIHMHTQWIREKLKSYFQYYFRQTGNSALFMLGLLNGLLPCGMVYIAMIAALTTGSSFQSAAFMAFFGLGTIPMMLSVSLLGTVVGLKWKNRIQQVTPVLACVVGILLILRGLNVEVPFVTPHECCQAQHSH